MLSVPWTGSSLFLVTASNFHNTRDCHVHFCFTLQTCIPFSLVLISQFSLQAIINNGLQGEMANRSLELSHLTEQWHQCLWHITNAFPEVLTSKLSLTHLLGNQIQLMDAKPVRSHHCQVTPPPQIKSFWEHIKQLFEEALQNHPYLIAWCPHP
jgi:hypothetical protein